MTSAIRKESHMRKPTKSLVFAAIAAAAVAAPAFADDNGMTAHYGDSWADVQAHNPNLNAVPSLQAQEYGRTPTTVSPAMGSNPPDPQAAPAAYSATPVAPGPAAIDAGANAPAPRSTPYNPATERAGTLGSGTTNGVDPTGVGAATMGGSPYGGNQDPARLPESSSTAPKY